LEPVSGCCVCGTGRWASPIATGEDFEYETSPDQFVAQQCGNCDLVYLDPRPAMSELSTIYGADYHAYEFTAERFGFAYRVRSALEKRRLGSWLSHLPDDARIIDVGAGDGFHLRLLADMIQGWQLEGVDPDLQAIESGRSAGLTMHHGFLAELDLPADTYDFAIVIMTIEHVDDPGALLREVSRILKPGGRIGIVTDNTGSPDFRMARTRHWGGYHFPRHWNLFNTKSLQRLAENEDLDVVKMTTMMSPVNWTYTIHNALKDWGAPRFVVRQFGLDKPLPLAFFTIFDSVLTLLGRGALLRAVLGVRS
jgi:SAM-dependent methyltransferase